MNTLGEFMVHGKGKLDEATRAENPRDHIAAGASFRNGMPIGFSKKVQERSTGSTHRIGSNAQLKSDSQTWKLLKTPASTTWRLFLPTKN